MRYLVITLMLLGMLACPKASADEVENLPAGQGIFTAKIPTMSSCTGTICSNVNQPQLSLLIMQPITKNLEFKSWSGIVPNFWANSDNGILYTVSPKVKVGGEVSYNHSYLPGLAADYMAVRGVIEIKVW